MEAVLNPNFSIGYEKTKADIYQELNSRIDTVILKAIKEYLKEKNVEFDGSYIDLKEFKKNVVPKLDKQSQIDVANIEKGLNEQLETLINSLKDGSTNDFKKFTDGIGNFSKSTVEMMARLTAVKTAYMLSPTTGGLAMGASIIGPKVVKTAKDITKSMKEDTQAALDVMLLKLGTVTKDGKNQYEVSEETRKLIASNLKREGIDISSNDTIHFLQDLSNLDNKQKEKAVNMLNNLSGNPYDVKKEIEKTKINLTKIKKIIGNDIVSPLSTAALFGLAAGSSLTETMPDLAPSIITALSAGAITNDLGIGVFSGGSQYLLSKFGNYIPIVGNVIEDVTRTIGAKETILATTGTAALLTLGVKIIPNLIYKGAKGTFNNIKNKIDKKNKTSELNEQIAIEDVENRIKKAKEDATTEIGKRSNKEVLLDVILDTLRSEGLEIPREVNTPEELKVYVNKLSNKDKSQVYKIVDTLEDIKENNTKNFKTTISGLAKTAYWGGVLALAGLGAYDAFLNPGFIDGLTSKKELENQISQHSREIDKDMINEQAELNLQKDLKTAEQQVNDSIDNIRKILPESKEEYNSLMSEQPGLWQRVTTFWKNNQRDYENNKAVELLGIDNEKGLNSFLQSIDPDDKNLKDLMDQLGVESIDELASNQELQASINLVGSGNWYKPNWDEYTGTFGQQGDFSFTGNREIGNSLIRIINSKYAENISDIPLQSASNDEITSYIESLYKDKSKIDSLSTYVGIHNKDANLLDHIIEDIDDYSYGSSKVNDIVEGIQGVSGNNMNMGEIKEASDKISELVDQYEDSKKVINEVQKKSEGFMDGINSKISTNPWRIAGTGATVGAGLEATNIFVKAKNFIKSKLFGRNKNKLLPNEKQLEDKNENKLKGTKRLDVSVDKDLLNKPIIHNQSEIQEERDEERL